MKVQRAVIDTNVFIFAFFRDQENHTKAVNLLSELGTWIIPHIVVVELFWFSRGAGLGVKDARDLILTFMLDDKAEVVAHPIEDIIDSLLIEDPLRWEDELILLLAEREGVPVATFDDDLRRRSISRGVPVIP